MRQAYDYWQDQPGNLGVGVALRTVVVKQPRSGSPGKRKSRGDSVEKPPRWLAGCWCAKPGPRLASGPRARPLAVSCSIVFLSARGSKGSGALYHSPSRRVRETSQAHAFPTGNACGASCAETRPRGSLSHDDDMRERARARAHRLAGGSSVVASTQRVCHTDSSCPLDQKRGALPGSIAR